MKPSYRPTEKYYNQESERLLFRKIEEDDIEKWLPFFEDTPSLRFLGMSSGFFKDHTNEERCEKWICRQINRMEENTFGQLAVIEKSSGRFIGVGGLITRMEDGVRDELEVTYSLLPEARGKGYASELATHFKNWAFENTAIHSVISIIHVDNIASQKVAANNGMKPERKMNFMEMPVEIHRVKRS